MKLNRKNGNKNVNLYRYNGIKNVKPNKKSGTQKREIRGTTFNLYVLLYYPLTKSFISYKPACCFIINLAAFIAPSANTCLE